MQSTFELITFTDKSKRTGFGFPHTYTRNGMHAWNYGRGMAHDILEHINGVEYIGSYADEIQALGAGYYVRDCANTGVASRANSESPLIFFGDHIAGRADMWLPVGWGNYVFDENFDPTQSEIYPFALELIQYVEKTINWLFSSSREELQPYIDKVIAFFCYGYEQAKAKYENYPVNDMFYVIADTFDNYMSNHKLVKGEELVLTLDPDNMSAYIEKKSSLALAA